MLQVPRNYNDSLFDLQLSEATPQAGPVAHAPGYCRLSATQRFGAMMERHILDRLQAQGYHCELNNDFNAAYDIRLYNQGDILPIEVKARRPVVQRRKAGLSRDVWPYDLNGGLGARSDHLFILVQVHRMGAIACYCVPSAYLIGAGRHSVTLTSPSERYSGFLSPFLEDWQQIAIVSAWRSKYNAIRAGQLSLFDSEVLQ